jgi:3-oxoacyl-[acyl-carrier-protein] synthase II
MRQVWVTGVGIVSAAGASITQILDAKRPVATDTERFSPYPIRPVTGVDFSTFVPKRSDQRAMSPMMLYAVEAAGQALTDSGMAGDADALSELGLFVAAGMADRDPEADRALLMDAPLGDDFWPAQNKLLQEKLRPTLFLAQLPNLVAGNISILLGVSGASRTLMGDEMAGVESIRLGVSQIANGARDAMLVGGTFSAERPEIIATYASAGHLLTGDNISGGEGLLLGSGSAFLILEEAERARARGARPYCSVRSVVTDYADRNVTGCDEQALAQWQRLFDGTDHGKTRILIDHTAQSRRFGDVQAMYEKIGAVSGGDVELESVADLFGNLIDAGAAALATLGAGYLSGKGSGDTSNLDRVVVVDWGHAYGESLIALERV